ncbi:MAG: cobyrinate a,c-diamide synthase [Chloroflexota bacterium]
MPDSSGLQQTPSATGFLPRLVIAAPQGRSGKTTISLGLCAAFTAQGLSVQPFKKGPDYIDPSWLSAAAKQPCRSLDLFFLRTPAQLLQAFLRGACCAELSLIEGNHGLYDGEDWIEGQALSASTAEVARQLKCPILLVVNAARMSRSAAALVHGYQTFEAGTPIAGVILNNVAQGRHEAKLRQAIENHCHIPVLGAIPRQENLAIPDRHLGLVPRAEANAGGAENADGSGNVIPALAACQQAAERYIDLPAVLEIARSAVQLPVGAQGLRPDSQALHPSPPPPPKARIGVVRDQAFTFYYPENLEALQQAGAQLIFINALQDTHLPQVDALLIGGGFPEIFMETLAANTSLRSEIREAIEAGLPVYAECGGLMYLAQHLCWGERRAEMVGALPIDVEMSARPEGHGYVLAEVTQENPFFAPGTLLRGHEFHHSRLAGLEPNRRTAQPPQLWLAYRLQRGHGIGRVESNEGHPSTWQQDGLVYRNVLASYTHLHADGSPDWAPALVARAYAYAQGGSPVLAQGERDG